MIDFFIKINSEIKDEKSVLTRIRYYSLQRFCLRLFTNLFIPIWFRLNNLIVSRKLDSSMKKIPVIISLTTFPARIGKVWLVVECMLRQTYKPDRIILWLSKNQFDGLQSLPKSLLKLQKKGLEIKFCEGDIRSHKKYFYSLKNFPEAIIITVDDDFFYPTNLIKELVKSHQKYPDAISCCRALKYRFTKNGKLDKYLSWEYVTKATDPSLKIFYTTGGGTLFKSSMFSEEVLNKQVFMNHCKYADDIWLNFMSLKVNTKVVKTTYIFEPIPILIFRDITLSSKNVNDGLNDKQWKDLEDFYFN